VDQIKKNPSPHVKKREKNIKTKKNKLEFSLFEKKKKKEEKKTTNRAKEKHTPTLRLLLLHSTL
jgi:hypothetical protein